VFQEYRKTDCLYRSTGWRLSITAVFAYEFHRYLWTQLKVSLPLPALLPLRLFPVTSFPLPVFSDTPEERACTTQIIPQGQGDPSIQSKTEFVFFLNLPRPTRTIHGPEFDRLRRRTLHSTWKITISKITNVHQLSKFIYKIISLTNNLNKVT